MDTLRLCTQCRTPLPAGSTDRLCPQCRTSGVKSPGTRSEPPECAAIGQFFPQLEVIEIIGHGGMGMVYKARQPQLDRFVALKILSPDLSGDPTFASRFTREAQSLAKLNHSNIVSIFDFGHAGPYFYLIMEFVDGDNLHWMIQDKEVGPGDAKRIATEICRALEYAHEESIIHRDIKPSNILIDKKGRVKIADFGLVKLAGKPGDTTMRELLTTVAMGTPHYMAPEQIETPSAVDHRADLYSLGVIYYEMLTGGLPIGRFDPPTRKLSQLQPALDEVILRSLHKDPERRFATAAQFRRAIETADQPVAAPPRWKWLKMFGWMAGTAALAVMFYLIFQDQFRPHRPPLHPGDRPTVEVDYTGNQDGPLFQRHNITELQLTKTQIMEVTRIIRRTQRDFGGLERRHTTRTEDKSGHIHLITHPFPEDMQQLMDHMWKDLGVTLTDTQVTKARASNWDQRFFPHNGHGTIKVEIWRTPNGEEHFVESEDPGSGPGTNGPHAPNMIPPRYRYYLPGN